MATKRQKHKLDKVRDYLNKQQIRALNFYLGNLVVAEIERLIEVS